LRLLQQLQEVRLVLAHLWDQEAQEDPELLAVLPALAIQLSLLALQDQPDPEVPVVP